MDEEISKHFSLLRWLQSNNFLKTPIQTSDLDANNHYAIFDFLNEQLAISSAALAIELARAFSLIHIDLAETNEPIIIYDILPYQLMLQQHLVPIEQKNNVLRIAIFDPTQEKITKELTLLTGFNCEFVVVSYLQLKKYLLAIEKHQHDNFLAQPLIETNDKQHSLLDETNADGPIAEYIDQIIIAAIAKKASDIHFEPYAEYYRIRFRIDGILYEHAQASITIAKQMAARIKVLAKLDIAEKRLPHDGRFRFMFNTSPIDFRVSTCPTIYGEKIVLRLLDSQNSLHGINELGLLPEQISLFINAISQPQGIILVTGPTGSGKTITLYNILNYLNSTEKNISTVEDPVEIQMPGINQVTINHKAGLTFAKILRAFLRQDPDIIMVGEMRDLETAEIAIKAAQTGHLVFSTLHTNSACEALTRLDNMGLNSFNIATSISLIVAQRLARKLCPYCKKIADLSKKTLAIDAAINIYDAVGCDRCQQGFSGRVGLFEILPISDAIRRSLLARADSIAILEQARAEKMLLLYEAGIEKIKQGVLSLTELHRVIQH